MERLSSWYEPEYDYENDCNCGDESNKKLENARDFMQAVVEMMYSKQDLNMSNFERCLEEACSYLEVDFPMDEIQIKRK